MRTYKDKNNSIVKEGNFILVKGKKICQALRNSNRILLYEELKWNFDKKKLVLSNKVDYPDSYKNDEIEIIRYNDVVLLLRDK